MLAEFRKFAIRGNVIDLAVGVIIGAAFGKIINSLVADIIMPLISFMLGGEVNFSDLFIILGIAPAGVPRTMAALKEAGVPLFAYGNFITVCINFILLAFVIFLMVRFINRLQEKEAQKAETAPPKPTEEVLLLREIRDNIKE